MKMKLKEYLSNAKFFPLMGVSQLNTIGEDLDKQMRLLYGEKSCGPLITGLVESDGTVTVENQTFIAKTIYGMFQNKWDSLIKFASEEIDPLVEKHVTTTTEYGKTVGVQLSGEDGFEQTDKLAGFDSEAFVNKDSNTHSTKYGKKSDTTNTGTDTKTVDSRTKQAEVLVDYTLKFWDKYGITRTVIADTLKLLTLPLYDLD